MPITEQDLKNTLTSAFPDADIHLHDLAGDDDHWSATISSSLFAEKSRLEQQRMVQHAVKHHDIHALQIKTQTKE